jgi:opacity protein-like surface antigen
MRKFLIAAALIVAYATPAFAEDFYVAVDLASGRCVMMSGKEPDAKHFKMMGKYATMDAAHKAMGTMRDCL